MIRLLLIALLSLVATTTCGRSSMVDDDTYFGITTTDKPTYTYWDYGQCQHLCELPCKWTIVNMPDDKKMDMYMCSQLKVIKASFIDNLKSGTFKSAIIVVVVVTISIMLCIACGYYCCCNRKEEDKFPGRDEFRELGPRDERKALNKGSVIEV
ncbi:Protein tipE [Caenorhabditis elegans]|uniref:Protein tipE n=1 Tax=Caenorhabditis elegans TaxID=6239 RepID=Q27GT0_CAEEL|nr:Protein tipE [Caenorhabditis elegans]CCD67929.1 Protein tipE [Caenorhabditis elegans]|eukprot:NP_001041230.2 Uncharacterized protein CELE_C53C11.5 [Caenorhabditis elegans]